MTSLTITIITAALMILGLAGTIIPALPGMGLIFGGIVLYAIATDFATISVTTVVIFGIVAGLGWLASLFGSAVGSKAGGGKPAAVIGAIIGSLFGASVAGPPGFMLGAFVGALIGGIIAGQPQEMALRSAFHSVVGILGGVILQFTLAVLLIIAFVMSILFSTLWN